MSNAKAGIFEQLPSIVQGSCPIPGRETATSFAKVFSSVETAVESHRRTLRSQTVSQLPQDLWMIFLAGEYQPQTRTGSSGAPLVANPESRPKYVGSIRIFQANNTHKQPG
jgi:hypothetical protein